MHRPLVPLLASLAFAATAADSVISPPATARRAETNASAETTANHSWELPAITVSGTGSELREEDRIGSYGQPRWTARRRFTETRTYVIPEGQVQFEYWLIIKDKRDAEPDEVQQVYELEIGLPYRFQLDLYQVYAKDYQHGTGEMALDATKFELRWALADWGKIWANPTLYAEWKASADGYDSAEGKLLLTDELAPRWHWGVNFVYERELGGEEAVAREVTGGISYTLLDERFSAGVESKFAWEDTNLDRGEYAEEQLVGPTFQFRPLPQMHIDFSVLFGLNDDSPKTKTALIAGWEF
jgi:hypothetical protein